jgi:hypothetical protein
VLQIPYLLTIGLRMASENFALDSKVVELHPLIILASTIAAESIVCEEIVLNLVDLFRQINIIIN